MRAPHNTIASALFLALALGAMQARADETRYPTTMAGLPEPVRTLLERREDGMADVGGPFSEWCVRKPGTFHARLVRAELGADTLRVRYERGGFAGPRAVDVEFVREGDAWTEVVRPKRLASTSQCGFGPSTSQAGTPGWKLSGN